VNTGGYDFSLISLKILPIYSCDGFLVGEDVSWVPDAFGAQVLSPLSCSQTRAHEDNFPVNLIQHHSVREIQVVSLSIDYHREKQVKILIPSFSTF
jgi:hypothetical protein